MIKLKNKVVFNPFSKLNVRGEKGGEREKERAREREKRREREREREKERENASFPCPNLFITASFHGVAPN